MNLSIGTATFPGQATDAAELLALADADMYRAKAAAQTKCLARPATPLAGEIVNQGVH